MEKRGRFFHDIGVICGMCNQERFLGATNHERALGEAKRQGWRRTKALGWMCPDCLPARRKAQTTAANNVDC